MGRRAPYPPETDAKIVADYQNGDSMHALKRRYGGCRESIRRRLEAAGVQLRTREERQHRFDCRHDAFASAEADDEAAYWVGMLMADGCISVCKHSTWVILTLAERDAGHVAKFRDFLGAPHKIMIAQPREETPNRQAIHHLRVASKQLAADLAKYGVVPHKSKTAEVRHLEMNRHFWRGVVDGDGSLGRSKRAKSNHASRPLLQVVGSESLMRQFETFAGHVTGTAAKAHLSHGCWGFGLCSGAATELISHLYTDCTVALDRKWSLAHELLCEWEMRPRRREIKGLRATC